MRLSRTNFPGQSEARDEGVHVIPETPEQQEQAALPTSSCPPVQEEASDAMPSGLPTSRGRMMGPEELPDWQSAFRLAPNVRFTRTPEKAMPRRAPAETERATEAPPISDAGAMELAPAPAIAARAPLSAQEIEARVQLRLRAQAAAAPSFEERAAQRGLVTRGLPTEPTPGARALVDELRREFVATRRQQLSAPLVISAASVNPQPQPSQSASVALPQAHAAPVPSAPPVQTELAAIMPHLPDHLFWEAIDIAALAGEPDGEGARKDAAPSTAVPSASGEPPMRISSDPNGASLAQQGPVASVGLDVEDDSPVLRYRMMTLRHSAAVAQPPAARDMPMAEVELVVPTAAPSTAPAVPEPAPRSANAHSTSPRRLPGFVTTAVVSAEDEFEFPLPELLQEPVLRETAAMTQEALEQSAGLLESVLEDFGIKGEIVDVRPGPVVTLYEFEPAPGVKSSRVIGLSDDIARSMSALSARVAVVPGRNVIGIELPNPERETVYFRELIESDSYKRTGFSLPLCLGKTIGGEPVIADLAKMPHLLVAGTTGSGKSVSVNTMILSLLYRLRPDECRLIMVDPKMLELSIYDGIPHLLTPVVTDPKKAVLALKWAVREMEDRYRKMSRLGVRNIDGYNARVAAARRTGETIMISVQIGFDRSTGEPLHEEQEMDLSALPYIVVIVDEMADLMMVAGKDIEGAIQRLAQMARAAGIHLIMATQRPSVDVITGTIKANFPTRISFQVTSKIDSRTILGEQGAEHLLGQGDMLHMVGGGRIARVHGPFVSDREVESVVAHLKTQGRPQYLGTVTEDADEPEEEADDPAVFDKSAMGEDDADDLYDRAVKVVLRDKKCSTSYIQRRLSIGYNRAASLVERMEKEGLVGPANHVGKRSIIAGAQDNPTEIPGA
jgi:S-DNA-T family DNA segregation ATPase FtsK/SpoIIIE